MTSPPELSHVEIWQFEHRSDIKAIQDYQRDFSNVVSNMKLDHDLPMSLVVLLWNDHDGRHSHAIRDLCEHPNDLVFEEARHAPDDLALIISEISNAMTGTFRQLGLDWDVVNVTVGAEFESVAVDLHRRFGDAISLTIGAFPYPPDRPKNLSEQIRSRMSSDRPKPLRPQPVDIPGLAARLTPPVIHIRVSGPASAMVELTNVGSSRLKFTIGTPVLSLVDPTSGEVIGGFNGFVAAPGRRIELDPGEKSEIPALAGLTSFKQELGYVVPAGRYVARAKFQITARNEFDSEFVPLRVVDAEAVVVH